jgi:hypothetical protein
MYVLKCFICFRGMLHSTIFILQVFRVVEVCLESHWSTARASWEGARRAGGLADRARGAPRFLRTGRARAHPGSRIPLARRERERRRVRGKERRTWGEARRGVRGRDTHAGCDVVDGKGLQRYGDSAIHFLWSILLGHSVPFNKILSHRTSGRHQFPRIFSPAKCAGWKLAKFGMSSGRRLTRGL